MLKKIIEKLKKGLLRDVIKDAKWIYTYARGYRGIICLYIFLGMLATAAGLASGIVSRQLINVVTGFDAGAIVDIAILYVCFGFTRIGMNAINKRIGAKMSLKVNNEIREDVYSKFLDMEWEASLDYHSGDLLTRVNSDVSTVAESVLGLMPGLITHLFQLVASLFVILYYDSTMALFAFFSAPVTLVISGIFFRKMRNIGKKVREANSELVSFYSESLQNLQTVKAFSLENNFCDKLKTLQTIYMDISLDYNKLSVLSGGIMSVLGFTVSCVCLGWGVFRMWTGHIDFGTMILFLQLAGMVAAAFSALVGLVPTGISATVSAGRIMAILDLPAESECDEEEVEVLYRDSVRYGLSVELEDIEFDYANGNKVFDGFDLKAESGEIIGIVSPSGGGKTTLIRMLLGLIHPSSGEVKIACKKTCREMKVSSQTRKMFSYVAQEKCIFSGTVADTLRIGNPKATDEELLYALRLAEAENFVLKLKNGINTKLAERGAGLSEGQIQRLAIARAILSNASVMLLDEATSALDVATERKVLRNLLKGETKRTIIVTTHRPTVLSMCNKVYRIESMKSQLLDYEEIQRIVSDF